MGIGSAAAAAGVDPGARPIVRVNAVRPGARALVWLLTGARGLLDADFFPGVKFPVEAAGLCPGGMAGGYGLKGATCTGQMTAAAGR